MASCEADFTQITLMIRRLLDAEVIETEVGEILLVEAEAASRFFQRGDGDSARRHVERISLFTEALVKTDALTLAEGRAVIHAADGILRSEET